MSGVEFSPDRRVRDPEWAEFISPSAPGSSPQVETQTVTPPGSITMEHGGESFQHTPGPWFPVKNSAGTWEAKIGNSTFDHAVAFISSGCPAYFRGDEEANVRLIAAAPELLEALIELIAVDDASNDYLVQMGVEPVEDHPAIIKCRAIMAKATGKGGLK